MPGSILDIFNDNAFSVTSLTQTINTGPIQPGRLGELGYFEESGITTTMFAIERKGSVLSLVPNAPRGAAGTPKHGPKRDMLPMMTTHLPQTDTILADQVQGVRAFGSTTELETIKGKVNEVMQVMKNDNEATIEFQRVGALRGQIIDADGASVIVDLHNAFGITRPTFNMALNTGGTNVRQKAVEFGRLMKKSLGNKRHKSKRAFCSLSFYDTFTNHAKVITAFDKWREGEFLRSDLQEGFFFAGVYWEPYDGGVGEIPFIPDGKAYVVPEGVPGLFKTVFAPADYMETVNTVGLPFYAKQERLRMDRGIEIEVQSNPMSYCAMPLAIQELVIS